MSVSALVKGAVKRGQILSPDCFGLTERILRCVISTEFDYASPNDKKICSYLQMLCAIAKQELCEKYDNEVEEMA